MAEQATEFCLLNELVLDGRSEKTGSTHMGTVMVWLWWDINPKPLSGTEQEGVKSSSFIGQCCCCRLCCCIETRASRSCPPQPDTWIIPA